MTDYIYIKATIDKADIATCAALKGCANATGMKLGDTHFVAGSLVYEGFAGAIDLKDRRYYGTHTFSFAEEGEQYVAGEFDCLVTRKSQPKAPRKPAPSKEVSDGVDADRKNADNG